MCGNKWCPFFRRAIHIWRNELSVPMQLFWRVCVVVNLNRYWLALLESQERTGKLILVGEGRDNVFISDVNRGSANAHGVIRCRSVLEVRGNAAQQPERWADHSCRRKHASFGQKFPAWRA